MKVLVVNAGSSSLKYQFIDMENEQLIAKGLCERIGGEAVLTHKAADGRSVVIEEVMPTHSEAFTNVIKALTEGEAAVISSLSEISAVGHRVVQGGSKFTESAVITEEIIAEAYNLSEHGVNACEHAEIIAMRLACEKLQTNRLWDMDLYVTLEPCTMCAAAISFMRIRKLFFGAEDIKGGAVVSGVKFYESTTCHHRPEVYGGICAEKCGQLLKDFFKSKRQK